MSSLGRGLSGRPTAAIHRKEFGELCQDRSDVRAPARSFRRIGDSVFSGKKGKSAAKPVKKAAKSAKAKPAAKPAKKAIKKKK